MSTLKDLIDLQDAVDNFNVSRETLSAMIQYAIHHYNDDKAAYVIKTLSPNERLALAAVFSEDETVASNKLVHAAEISEKTSLPRSIIVNAFRKAEDHGLIKTKSLGLEGTLVNIIDVDTFSYVIKMIRKNEI